MGMASVSVLLSADPPSHDEQRKLVSRAFTPRRVRDLEPRIREIAEDLVEGFVARGHCEFISEFAVGLPLRVIAESLGVPPEDMAMFKRWSDDLTAVIGNHQMSADQLRRMLSAFVEFFAYFTERIVERRAAPSEDLISAIVYSAAEGERPLSDPEMLAMFAQFLVAGNETTTKLLGSLLLLLLEQPELLAALRADSSKIPQLVEETLRLESPVQGLFRVANVDTEVGGVSVRAGSSLWVIYASGNRDAEEFTCPDVADLERANSRSHLAFGNGVHYCLGAALARAEARIGLEVILERLDDLALDGEADLLYERSYVLHGLRQLPITFRRR
jgi:cytochrome P450